MKKLYLILLGLTLIFATSCKDKNSAGTNPLKFTTPTLDVAQYQTAAVQFSNAPANATIIFTSSNTKVAIVESDGTLKALTVGTAFINAFVEGDREATQTIERLTVNVTNNPVTSIEVIGDNREVVKDTTVDFFVKLNPQAAASNREVTIVSTDSVGMKFVSFTTHAAKDRSNPDTLRAKGLEYGKVEFFVEQGDVKSNRIELKVVGEIKSTDFKFGLTPQQIKENRQSYNTSYVVGGSTPDPITKIDRTACDTILFNILPFNSTENILKYEISQPGAIAIREILLEVEENGVKVTKKGLEVKPVAAQSTSSYIKISTNGGYQLQTNPIYVSSAAGKFAEISKVEFAAQSMDLTKWSTSQSVPEVKFTYKNAGASSADIAYTNRNFVTYEFVSDYEPANGQPLAENLELSADYKKVKGEFGASGYGVAQLRVNVWNEAKTEVIANDTCNISVNAPIESAVFKSEHQFINGKYVVSALVNPMFNTVFANTKPEIKAELIFKKDDETNAVVKETITLVIIENANVWYSKGEFTPFEDGKRLSQYSVRYTFTIKDFGFSGNKANYWYKSDKIDVYTPTPFVGKQ